MSFAAKENCYAVMWSYGISCVGCGCCKRGAYEERLEYHKEQLEHDVNFNQWLEGVEDLQRKNIAANIKYEKRKIRELERKIKARNDKNTSCES